MKIKCLLHIICCLGYCSSFAYSDSTIVPKDLKNLAGCWNGSLTYLDYTSNKPFTMPADLVVKDFGNSNAIVYALIYPNEPKANSTDTLFISEQGRKLNNERITWKKKYKGDSLKIITAIPGIDGNDNKQAIIRHTYLLSSNTYSIKKEVQFTGQTQWILRNEYKFTRKTPCN